MKAYLALWVSLTGAVYAYLAALGVDDMGVYVSLLALSYFITLALARPVALHYRKATNAVAAALFTSFLYFAITKVISLVG